MYLKLNFRAISGAIFDHHTYGSGLDIVTATRELLDMPSLPISKINSGGCYFENKKNVEFLLDEENEHVINASKHLFAVRNNVTVSVPSGFIGRYVKLSPKIVHYNMNHDNTWFRIIFHVWPGILTGYKPLRGIHHVDVIYTIDTKELFNDWVADGCPTFWYVSPDEPRRAQEELRKAREKDNRYSTALSEIAYLKAELFKTQIRYDEIKELADLSDNNLIDMRRMHELIDHLTTFLEFAKVKYKFPAPDQEKKAGS